MSAHEKALEAVRRQARACFRHEARQGMAHYSHSRLLPDLISFQIGWVDEQFHADITEEILAALKHALCGVIAARANHYWYYDRGRHLALLQAIAGEMMTLKSQRS